MGVVGVSQSTTKGWCGCTQFCILETYKLKIIITNKLLHALHEEVTLNPAEVEGLVAHCAPSIRNISTAVPNVVYMADTLLHIHIWYVYTNILLHQGIMHFIDVSYNYNFNASSTLFQWTSQHIKQLYEHHVYLNTMCT